MSYRILTKNAVENTNIDGARDHNFNAGRRSGIVQGALNSGNLFLSANNTIALDTCELRLCGHRVVIDGAEYKTFYNQPSVPIRYSLVAQIIVSNNGESVSFDLKTQLSTIPLVQNDLDKNINGTYELEIGRFTQLTDGTLTDVVRTADLITGGGNNDSEYIRIGTVTTNKISPELDADVDIENTINPDDNKPQTNFTFNLPTSVGTVVSVNGEEKTSINTDITPIASSENLITSGGVHDYPAVTFAESERQKSKNLFDISRLKLNNGVISGNTITTSTEANVSYNTLKEFADLDVGKTYILTLETTSNAPYIYVYGMSASWASGTSLTMTQAILDSKIVIYGNRSPIAGTETTTSNIMIRDSSDTDSTYQPYNGAIVHEKDIFGASTLTLIYSKNSTDANLNKGKTTGIYETSGAVSIDFNEYDFALCKIRSDQANHDYTASLFMLIPLKYGVGLSGNYTGCISVENPYNVIRRNTAKINMISIFATIPTTKDSISIFTTSHNEEQTPVMYENVAIEDIWGVKLL